MANSRSAMKRIRQNEKRRLRNRSRRNRARTLVNKARTQIEAGDVASAEEATRIAIRDLDKAAGKGVIHKRNAARRKARLMKRLNTLRNVDA